MCQRRKLPQFGRRFQGAYVLIEPLQNVKRPNHARKRVKKTLLGKRLTAALPTSPAKWIHSVLVRIRLFRATFAFEKPLGHEPVWVGEVARISVDGPHIAGEIGTGGEVVAFVIEIDGVGVGDSCEDSHGSPSEGFFDLWRVRYRSAIENVRNLPLQSRMEAHLNQFHPSSESDRDRQLHRTQRGLLLVLPGSAPLLGCKKA